MVYDYCKVMCVSALSTFIHVVSQEANVMVRSEECEEIALARADPGVSSSAPLRKTACPLHPNTAVDGWLTQRVTSVSGPVHSQSGHPNHELGSPRLKSSTGTCWPSTRS